MNVFIVFVKFLGQIVVIWVKLFFFLGESFNLWRPLLMIALYHQTKTLISFWYRRGLNPRSLIQPSEILPVELTRTHRIPFFGLGLKISM